MWSVVKVTGTAPSGRSRAKAVVYYNKMYVFGGWDRKNYFSDLYEFNFGKKKFLALIDLQKIYLDH